MKVKNAVASRAKRKKWIKLAKGYWGQRKSNIRRVKETVRRALRYGYRDRRAKKREFRSLWIVRLNAAVRLNGLTYRDLISGMKAKNIIISRDILAQIASEQPKAFERIIELVKAN